MLFWQEAQLEALQKLWDSKWQYPVREELKELTGKDDEQLIMDIFLYINSTNDEEPHDFARTWSRNWDYNNNNLVNTMVGQLKIIASKYLVKEKRKLVSHHRKFEKKKEIVNNHLKTILVGISSLAKKESEKQILMWRLGILTTEELTKEWGCSKSTLRNRWLTFQKKIKSSINKKD